MYNTHLILWHLWKVFKYIWFINRTIIYYSLRAISLFFVTRRKLHLQESVKTFCSDPSITFSIQSKLARTFARVNMKISSPMTMLVSRSHYNCTPGVVFFESKQKLANTSRRRVDRVHLWKWTITVSSVFSRVHVACVLKSRSIMKTEIKCVM